MTNLLTQQLQPVVEALRQGLGEDLVAVVLFGSRARGDARPESDWDLLLIANQLPTPFFARHHYLQKCLPPDWVGQVSILAKTTTEFAAGISSLFLDIALDGIILYDPTQYAAKQLAYLQKLIQQKGLYRREQGREMSWHWQHFPGLNWQLSWNEKI